MKLSPTLLACALALSGAFACPTPLIAESTDTAKHAVEAPKEQPLIQIAILLDNSGSMGGLIEQAKTQIWSLVNEFITAKQFGKQPQLQIALFTYGDPPPKMIVPLSEDLDKVSQELFAISISGGSEYCGQVIDHAVDQLSWSKKPGDLKVIFIAGNEEFSQGPVNYREACKKAINNGIIVNTIHCGNGIPQDWKEGALLADGKAMSIDQNQATVYIQTPHDKRIQELSGVLNKTYISYGAEGKSALANQTVQDNNASGSSVESVMQRAVSKANRYYKNDSWDLVDATKDDFKILDTLKTEQLPEELRDLSREKQIEYINKQRQERMNIQKEINELNAKRKNYILEQEKLKPAAEKSLDAAMKEAILEQAAEKDFSFSK